MTRHASESLFDEGPATEDVPDTSAPLAERMRPRTLEEFAGQQHLVGEGRVLRRVIEGGGLLPSLILCGAPGGEGPPGAPPRRPRRLPCRPCVGVFPGRQSPARRNRRSASREATRS